MDHQHTTTMPLPSLQPHPPPSTPNHLVADCKWRSPTMKNTTTKDTRPPPVAVPNSIHHRLSRAQQDLSPSPTPCPNRFKPAVAGPADLSQRPSISPPIVHPADRPSPIKHPPPPPTVSSASSPVAAIAREIVSSSPSLGGVDGVRSLVAGENDGCSRIENDDGVTAGRHIGLVKMMMVKCKEINVI
ncbi:hypothetical protein Dimus_036540 [Dionaea muscipula]